MESDSINDKKIFELTEVFEETNGNNSNNQEVIVIDGRGYEKNFKPKDLNDAINDSNNNKEETELNDELIKKVKEITEKIALELIPEITEKISREMVPKIAEKVIREEIEKLKKISGAQ